MKRTVHVIAFVGAMLSASSILSAATIGNWSGSSRSWNNSDLATIKSLMTSRGHTVEADGAMTAANLANDDLFVVGASFTSTPSASNLADLSSYVNNGGVLLILTDAGGSGSNNSILSGIGSAVQYGADSTVNNGPIQGGVFASEGGPFNIVGQSFSVSPGTEVMSGGNLLAGSFARWEQIGSGFVFVLGDRMDFNFFNPSAANVNGQFFINLVEGGNVVPLPAAAWIALPLLGGLGITQSVKRKRSVE